MAPLKLVCLACAGLGSAPEKAREPSQHQPVREPAHPTQDEPWTGCWLGRGEGEVRKRVKESLIYVIL